MLKKIFLLTFNILLTFSVLRCQYISDKGTMETEWSVGKSILFYEESSLSGEELPNPGNNDLLTLRSKKTIPEYISLGVANLFIINSDNTISLNPVIPLDKNYFADNPQKKYPFFNRESNSWNLYSREEIISSLAISLNDNTDISIGNNPIADKDILCYNSTTKSWENIHFSDIPSRLDLPSKQFCIDNFLTKSDAANTYAKIISVVNADTYTRQSIKDSCLSVRTKGKVATAQRAIEADHSVNSDNAMSANYSVKSGQLLDDRQYGHIADEFGTGLLLEGNTLFLKDVYGEIVNNSGVDLTDFSGDLTKADASNIYLSKTEASGKYLLTTSAINSVNELRNMIADSCVSIRTKGIVENSDTSQIAKRANKATLLLDDVGYGYKADAFGVGVTLDGNNVYLKNVYGDKLTDSKIDLSAFKGDLTKAEADQLYLTNTSANSAITYLRSTIADSCLSVRTKGKVAKSANSELLNGKNEDYFRNPANMIQNGSYRFVTDTEKNNLNTAYNHTHIHNNISQLNGINQNLSTSGTPSFAGGSFSGNISMANGKWIKFIDKRTVYPTDMGGFLWDLNNDIAQMYAVQPANDAIDFVFKIGDNTNSQDRFVFFIDDYRGEDYDVYPLKMDGTKAVFDVPVSLESSLNTNVVTNLNADLLDGKQATEFALSTQLHSHSNKSILDATTSPFTTELKNKLDGVESGATGDMTPTEILTALKTVDGYGSGLDASYINGISTARMLVQKADIPSGADLNTYSTTGLYHQNSNAYAESGSNYPLSCAGMLEVVKDGVMIYQKYHLYGELNKLYTRCYYNGVWSQWSKLWNENNDGNGSGLDADLLDGRHASSFVASVVNSGNKIQYKSVVGTVLSEVIPNFAEKSAGLADGRYDFGIDDNITVVADESNALWDAQETQLFHADDFGAKLTASNGQIVLQNVAGQNKSSITVPYAVNSDRLSGYAMSDIISELAFRSKGTTTDEALTDWNAQDKAGISQNNMILGKNANGFNPNDANYYYPVNFKYNATSNITQLAVPYVNIWGGRTIYMRSRYQGAWKEWTKFWTDAIDGAGSGLDADLIDGKNSTDFVASIEVSGSMIKAKDIVGNVKGSYVISAVSHADEADEALYAEESDVATRVGVLTQNDIGTILSANGTKVELKSSSKVLSSITVPYATKANYVLDDAGYQFQADDFGAQLSLVGNTLKLQNARGDMKSSVVLPTCAKVHIGCYSGSPSNSIGDMGDIAVDEDLGSISIKGYWGWVPVFQH